MVAGLNLFQNYLNEPNFKIHQEIQSANNIIIDWDITVSLLFFKSIQTGNKTENLFSSETNFG